MLTFNRLRSLAAFLPLALLCFVAAVPRAHARTQEANVTPVLSFAGSTVADKPSSVRGDMLLANDGNIYFASTAGGKGAGAIGKLAPDGTLSVLYAFAKSEEGVSSYASLMQATDGNLYGTTFLGGDKEGGAVFRVSLSGTFAVVHSFGQDNRDAILPYAGLVQAPDGNLYGTTLRGGNNDKGTIFRLGLNGDFAILHHFDGSNGDNPEGTLIVGSDGNLYGTTLQGGADNRGTIFRISTSGTYALVYSFPSLGSFNAQGFATNATGANPRAGLLLGIDGNYYGTAYQGGTGGHGTVFRMTPAGTVTSLYAFTGPSFGGSKPLAGLAQDSAGNLYGTTEVGGYLNNGSAWRVTPAGQFSLLHGFTNALVDGGVLYSRLLLANGTIYAMTFSDALAQSGAIVKLDMGTGGVLPVEFSVSPAEISTGSSATVTWSSPTAASCTSIGTWTATADASMPNAGTQSVTPAGAGIYTYGLSCTDAAGVVRNGYTALTVRAPPLEPVDGGGGTGAVSIPLLLLFAALLSRKYLKEFFPACP